MVPNRLVPVVTLLAVIASAPGSIGQESKDDVPGPYLGIRTSPLPASVRAQIPALVPEAAGLLVTHVVPDSPAAAAGVKPYDVVVSLAGRDVSRPEDVTAGLSGIDVGAKAEILAIRGGRRVTLTVTVGAANRADARLPGDLRRAALPLAEPRAPVKPSGQRGIAFSAGPISERSLLLVTTDGTSFRVDARRGDDEWQWTHGAGRRVPDDLPKALAARVATIVEGVRAERERGVFRFRVQPRAVDDDRSVVLLLQQPGADGSYRVLELERPIEGDTLPVDELVESRSLDPELERLSPAVRDRLESALRRYRLPGIRARVRIPR